MVLSRTVRADLTLLWAVKFVLHVSLLFVALVLAIHLVGPTPSGWLMTGADALRLGRWAGLYALIGAGVELFFQSERAAWRFTSMRELVGLVRSVTLTVGLFLGLIFFLDRGAQLPRSVLPLTWLLSVALLVGFRVMWRLPYGPRLMDPFLPSWWPLATTERKPLLIVGPMEAADRQLRMIQSDANTPYQPVGVVTPHPEEVGLRLHGVPFISSLSNWPSTNSALNKWGGRSHAIVFLDDPVQCYGLSIEQIGELRRAGHALLKPQNLADITNSPDARNLLREIPLEDFLPRKPISLDSAKIRNLVAGHRMMVTGAGGSIGSELCRQLLELGCAHLSMVDHSEFLLFEIDRELAGTGSPTARRAILANVRDTERVVDIVRVEKPDLIFHAAALKHVALVENNPAEGVLTNVLGTWNVIQAAVANNVSQFVLISTDKAVAPTNVMGATKRIAESLLNLAPEGETRMTAVRFGNVLGSAGSVVPIFRDQIALGGPVTVTHPDVNRFFMTIPEAVLLVLHSAAIGADAQAKPPRKFLLEMGKSVKIADLARQMIELSGKIPDVEVKIEFTGLKPGEKLTEMLCDEGEEALQCVEGIKEIKCIDLRGALKKSALESLIAEAWQQDAKIVKKSVLDLGSVVGAR